MKNQDSYWRVSVDVSSQDVEVVRVIAREEIQKAGLAEQKDPEEHHNHMKETGRGLGVNVVTCKGENCGPMKTTDIPFGEDDYHDCPECSANRVLNGKEICPWCSSKQEDQ